jgi:hypothetical protein
MVVFPREDDLVGELGMAKTLAAHSVFASVFDNRLATLHSHDTGREALGKLDSILADDGLRQGDLGKESVVGNR